jgi:hypothetical protein
MIFLLGSDQIPRVLSKSPRNRYTSASLCRSSVARPAGSRAQCGAFLPPWYARSSGLKLESEKANGERGDRVYRIVAGNASAGDQASA